MIQLRKENGGFKYETIQEVNEYVGTNHFDYRILRYCVKQRLKKNIKRLLYYFNLQNMILK